MEVRNAGREVGVVEVVGRRGGAPEGCVEGGEEHGRRWAGGVG